MFFWSRITFQFVLFKYWTNEIWLCVTGYHAVKPQIHDEIKILGKKTISLKKVSVQKEVQKKESQFESIKISAYSFEKFVR